MELKYSRHQRATLRSFSFKSHLYGIEIKVAEGKISPRQRLNRTFMELKYNNLLRLSSNLQGLNRTFMELK